MKDHRDTPSGAEVHVAMPRSPRQQFRFCDDYRTAPMPPVNEGLLGGKLAWRQDDGGHTDAPNMKYFIHWANKFIGYPDRN